MIKLWKLFLLRRDLRRLFQAEFICFRESQKTDLMGLEGDTWRALQRVAIRLEDRAKKGMK